MKALKIVGFILGGILVLLAVLIALALTPSIQTWAVKKAVAGQPGMQIEVGRVSAGFSAADITDLRYAKDGMLVTAKSVSARYNAWDYLSKKRINADSVVAQDLLIDLRNAKPAPAQTPNSKPQAPNSTPAGGTKPKPDASEPFRGILEQAKLPFDVRVASLTANGRALLTPEQTVVFDVKGTGIQTGQRGKLEWTVDFADSTSGAPLQALRANGAAHVRITNDQRIDLVEVDTVASALGPKLPPDRIQVAAKLEQPAAGGNESYQANLSLLRGNTTESLLKIAAQFLAASREIAGTWDLNIRTDQLAAVLAGLGLPELAANGNGKFTLKPDTTAVSATGDLRGEAAKLDKVAPALAGIGAMRFAVSFDGGLANNVAQLNKLALQANGADGRKFADITTAQRVGYELATQRITFADAKAPLAQISIQQLPLAWAQPVLTGMNIDSGDLSLALAVEAEPDGSRVRARAVEPLALRDVTVRQGDKKLADRVTLTARPAVDYSTTRILGEIADLNISMPTGDTVTGKLNADVTNLTSKPAIAFSSQINARIVEAIKPYLPVPLNTGPLAIVSVTEGRMEGDVLELAKATTTVNRDTGALLVAVETQQPLRVDLKTTTIAAANPQAQAARVRLGEIPLSWAEPFVANSKLAGSLAGGVLDVTLRSLEDLTLNTTEPVALRGVTVALEGKPTLNALDLTANLTATKRGNTIAYELRRAEVKQGPALLAGLSVTGEANLGGPKPVVSAKGNLEADVPALTQQPALANFATLRSGRVTATFDANLADATQAKAVLSAKNLVAKADNRALGDLEVNLTAMVKPDGSGTITAPITLTNAARKSDISIDGAFGKAADQKTFLLTGRIASTNLVVDDFEPLAGLAPKSEATQAVPSPGARTASTPTPNPKPQTPNSSTGPQPKTQNPEPKTASRSDRDAEPFWKGVNGKVEVDLKRILYGKDYVISGVRGAALITDTRLSVDGISGRLKESPFKLAGGMQFAARQPKPYSVTVSADVQGLNVGEILRAANPSEKPTFETTASLVARLNGNGINPVDTLKNAFGRFELTGTQGITRILANRGAASTAVSVVSGALAIAGIFQKNEKSAQALAAGSQLTQLLNEVRFDTAKVVVERNPDLSFKITSLEILSPILRASGTGTIASKSVDDVANAPMNIQLQLGAKNEFAYALQRTGLLSAQPDKDGYHLLSQTFAIGGTPSKVDNTSIWAVLGKLGLDAFFNR